MMKKYIKKFIDSQLIIADKITAFAGSMKFVYISVKIIKHFFIYYNIFIFKSEF